MEEQAILENRLRQAQIDKTLAEAEKLRREAAAADRQFSSGKWTEPLKLFGAAILGAGGVVAAITQFEVAELKARAAQHSLALAEKAKSDADTATKVAVERLQFAEKAKSDADTATKVAVERLRTAEVQTTKAVSLAASASQVRASAERAASEAARRLSQAEAQAGKAQRELEQARGDREQVRRDVAALKVELQQTADSMRVAQGQAVEARAKLNEEVLAGLQPVAEELARKLLEKAHERGIQLRLTSGFRSPQQQEELFLAGRTKARRSVHNTGLAFDVAVVIDGKLDYNAKLYTAVGEIGRELGLVWGGERRSFPDYPHFETASAQEELKRLLGSERSAEQK